MTALRSSTGISKGTMISVTYVSAVTMIDKDSKAKMDPARQQKSRKIDRFAIFLSDYIMTHLNLFDNHYLIIENIMLTTLIVILIVGTQASVI